MGVALALLASSCNLCSVLHGYERDIKRATEAIAAATTDTERAVAYSARGLAAGEKARYLRAFQRIQAEDYRQLFAQAVRDHDQAIALAPSSAESHFLRGRTSYDRATALDFFDANNAPPIDTTAETTLWSDRTLADFTRTLELDPRHALALDMRGLLYLSRQGYDDAIVDFAVLAKLDPDRAYRLADGYCLRGEARARAQQTAGAIADYEQAVQRGAKSDGCSCEPYNPLVGLYLASQQWDAGWRVVQQAARARSFIAPELLAELRRGSGRAGP